MSIDSTANLLFNIGANSDDAEENIARFRKLLGTDLDEMAAQSEDWAHELVGEIGTVQAAMTAGGAIIGASLVAIGAASIEAADKYAEYVGEVARGSKTTGIAAEDMSALRFAAAETNTSYESLVTGLTRFASTVAKANEGGTEQQKMFARLGISQEQVKAGEKDLLPLLMATADSFQHMGSQVQRSAAARDLFSRGGPELIKLLSMGSEGLKKFAEEAREMGLVVGSEDVEALNKYKATLNAIKAEQESLDVEIGRKTLPLLETAKLGWLGLWKAILAGHFSSVNDLVVATATNAGIAAIKVDELAKSLGKVGEGSGIDGIDHLDGTVKEAKGDFGALSGLVENISERMAESAGATGKASAEISHMTFEIARAVREYQKLASEGKLTGEAMQREGAAMAQLPEQMAQLSEQLLHDAAAKGAEAYQQFSDDITRRIQSEQVKTFAGQVAAWDQELAGLCDKLAKEKDISTEGKTALFAALDQLQNDGDTKLWRDQNQAMIEAYNSLDRQTEAQSERSYAQQVAAWNREIDEKAAQLAKEAEFEGQYDDRIAALRKAGLDKIERDQAAAYTREMSALQSHMNMMLNAEATQVTKLADQYNKDLRAFSQAEEAKVFLTAKSGAERAAIEAQFAALRKALLDKYALDLQGLENSQGWQGIFGSKFASMLKGNEALEKQWATSSNQSLLLVKVALENLKEMGQKAFAQMAQGMGAGIASALVYSKSVGAAMEAVLKSTLESLAGQAFAQAIYSTAVGLLDLAEYNPAGAAAAFEAAAMFGAVGAAAGVAGRAIPGGGAGSGGSGGSGGGSGSSSDRGASAGMTAAPTNTGPHVVVNVNGHVYGSNGIQELASAINDAVLNRDVTLTATNTKTGQVVNQ